MVLRGDEERVVVPAQLDDLDEPLIGRGARADEPSRLEPAAQVVIDLIAMPVALVHDRFAVELAHPGPVVQLHRVGAEAHGPAHVGDLLLLGQEVDHRVRRLRVHLGRVRALHPDGMPGEFGDGDLHPEADSQVRNLVLAGDLGGPDLALEATAAKAAGDEDAVGLRDRCRDPRIGHLLRIDPIDFDLAAVMDAGVAERLGDRQVGVLKLDVLADQGDP